MSKAAEEMFISQPAATVHLRTLQERLGAKLLYRDGNRMRPTEAGQVVYAWASQVLTRSLEMARRIEGLSDGTAGSAQIAASMTVGSYILPGLLSRFRAERPNAQITLSLFDPEHAVAAVRSGDCDIAVLIGDVELEVSDLAGERIGEQRFILVASPESGLESSINVSRIAELGFVAPPRDLVRERLVRGQLRNSGVEMGPTVLELGHGEAMKRAVREGAGVAFVFAASVEDELAAGTLREITIEGLDAPLVAPVYIVHRDIDRMSPMQADLVEAIRQQIGAPSGVEASRPTLLA